MKGFLPSLDEAEILYGKDKMFFKDYAYSLLVKKYIKYVSHLMIKCHKVTSLFIRNCYVNKR